MVQYDQNELVCDDAYASTRHSQSHLLRQQDFQHDHIGTQLPCFLQQSATVLHDADDLTVRF